MFSMVYVGAIILTLEIIEECSSYRLQFFRVFVVLLCFV